MPLRETPFSVPEARLPPASDMYETPETRLPTPDTVEETPLALEPTPEAALEATSEAPLTADDSIAEPAARPVGPPGAEDGGGAPAMVVESIGMPGVDIAFSSVSAPGLPSFAPPKQAHNMMDMVTASILTVPKSNICKLLTIKSSLPSLDMTDMTTIVIMIGEGVKIWSQKGPSNLGRKIFFNKVDHHKQG